MKIVFAGTPAFAATALEALLHAGHEIALVLTQPDRPAGRGLRSQPSAVKRLARMRDLEVLQPAMLKDPAALNAVAAERPQALVVVAFGLILPPEFLDLPQRGCFNVHASLLPRWRGAAPIQRALLAGDTETGITIMQMDAGLDTGAILLQEAVPISADDTTGTLHDKLAALGARLIVHALEIPAAPRPQDASRATYAARITRSDSEIDWGRPAPDIERQVRAFEPAPGAQTRLADAMLKIWRARTGPAIAAAPPGTVIAADADGLVVACGAGTLRILELQRAGGKRLAAQAFLSGYRIARGARFGTKHG